MLYPLSYGRLFFSCVADVSAAAEARGFEPPVAFKGDNSLAVSPIRPLWHASRRFTADPTAYTCRDGTRQSAFRPPIDWSGACPSAP